MGRKRRKADKSAFTRNLNALMQEREMTIAQAAKIAQVPHSTLGDWKAGTHPEDFAAAHRLANYFNVSLAFLLTGQEDKKNTAEIPPVSAVFSDGGLIFDGHAHIIIRRLIHRNKKGGPEEGQS